VLHEAKLFEPAALNARVPAELGVIEGTP